MFCPRCGRPVSDIANFCGGCGLPRAEIEKANRVNVAPVENTVKPDVDIFDIDSEISKLENDLSGAVPVVDYNTEQAEDTNSITTPSDFIRQEIKEENINKGETLGFGQSEYSYNRPNHYNYTDKKENTVPPKTTYAQREYEKETEKDQNLSPADFIWMMLISGLPVIGMLYIFWLAFIQKDNVNKRSYARAVLIITLFSFIMVFVFAMGLIFSQVAMYY